jgi:hypothetical protein
MERTKEPGMGPKEKFERRGAILQPGLKRVLKRIVKKKRWALQ